tara:strand:+ start:1755 stop:2861 length:1107 start_codon:yes stop_codon:yes gene_type:complete
MMMKKWLLILLFGTSLFLYGCELSEIQGILGADEEESEVVDAPEEDDSGDSFSCAPVTLTAGDNSLMNVVEAGQSVRVEGNYAYMGSDGSNSGLQIYDVTDPLAISNLGFFSTYSGPGNIDSNNSIYGMDVDGDYVYLVTAGASLIIVDVSDKSNPTYVSHLDYSGESWAVLKEGNYVYMGGGSIGLNVIDVSDVNNPALVGNLPNADYRSIQKVGNFLYGGENDRITISDVSDPTAPTMVGNLDVTIYTAYESFVKGDYLYTLDKPGDRLLTYNVSDPSDIQLVDTDTSVALDFRTIGSVNDHLFIGTGSSSSGTIEVFDISSNPANPEFITSFSTINRVYELDVTDSLVFAAINTGDIQVIQICTP